MASNGFGTFFRITTWGESHGKAIGVVIDGCPAGLFLKEEEIQEELDRRAPGTSPFVSPRKEPDRVEIYSGVFEGKTTGAPISLIIFNQDVDSSSYTPIEQNLRPGHAQFTYLEKYGIFDFRGSGRASARETACRVAAGAIAKKLLKHFGIEITAYIKQIGTIISNTLSFDLPQLKGLITKSPLFCPDREAEKKMMTLIENIQEEKDSIGGIVEAITSPLPIGLGDPIYEKLEANLAKAMLSIPATKGFEIGSGFEAAQKKGSEHNDLFYLKEDQTISLKTNHAGGTLGGISTGEPLCFRIAFKPPSSIGKSQTTVTTKKEEAVLEMPLQSRHDPCVAIRAVPVVEAMTACVLVDALLMHRISCLDQK